MALGAMHLSVSVLGLDVIGKGLGLLELGRVVVVVVILGADVVHLVDAAALGASLNGALAGELSELQCQQFTSIRPGFCVKTYAEPVNVVRVGGETSATSELLLTGGSDDDGLSHRTQAGSVERAHIEDIDTLHLTENLQALQTGGLLEIGRDGTGLGTGTEEVVLAADLCGRILVSGRSVTMGGRPRLCMTRVEAIDGGIVETYPSESCRRRPSCRQSRRGQRPAPWGWKAWKPHLFGKQESAIIRRSPLAGRGQANCVRRTNEVVKVRATTGETAARRAAAMAERCKNIVMVEPVGWGRSFGG